MMPPSRLLLAARLLFFLLVQPAAGLLGYGSSPSVHLHLIAADYAKLTVGNPGKVYTFRINLTLSDIHFHRHIETESRTVESLPDGSGTELIYIGHSAYRLPFHYAAYDASDRVAEMTTATQNVATLGLGKNSPLWKYWRSYSLTKDRLTLGRFDSYARLSLADWPPLISISAPPDFRVNDDVVYPVSLQFHRFDLELPHGLFVHSGEISRLSYHGSEDCSEQYLRLGWDPSLCTQQQSLQFYDQSVTLTDGLSYSGVQQSYDGRIHFGRRFLEDYVLFVDLDSNQLLLTSSIFSWGESDFTALTASTLFAVHMLVWLPLVLLNDGSQVLGILYAEALSYAVALIALFVNLVGFRWQRFATAFLERDSWLLTGFVVVQTGGFSLAGLWLLASRVKLPLRGELSERREQLNRRLLEHHLLTRILLCTGTVLTVLWYVCLPQHTDPSDSIFSQIAGLALCATTLLCSMHLALQGHERMWLLIALIALQHTAFIMGTLFPLHRLFVGPVVNLFLFCTFYMLMFCWFPVFVAWAKIQQTMAKYYARKVSAGRNERESQVHIAEAFYYWTTSEPELLAEYAAGD